MVKLSSLSFTVTECVHVFIAHAAEVTLAQLQNLDGTDVRIIDTVAAEWRNVAYALKFDDHVIKAIEKSKCRCEDACRDMFNRWINGVGTQPHTWIALAEALKTARYSHIAEQVLNWLLGKHTPSGSAKVILKQCMHKLHFSIFLLGV